MAQRKRRGAKTKTKGKQKTGQRQKKIETRKGTKRTVGQSKAEKWLSGARQRVKRSDAASKGWETRRERAAEQIRARKRIRRLRAERAQEKADKEAKRLRKWRKSYREYLKFRVPKVEREELAVPEKKELVCRVWFDREGFEDAEGDFVERTEEHIWTNVELLLGPSINMRLARIFGASGIVRVTFRLIDGAEWDRMQRGTMEDAEEGEYGQLIVLDWELDTERKLFWSNYYAHARTLLPARPEKGGQDYKASFLGVVRMEVCYAPDEAEA